MKREIDKSYITCYTTKKEFKNKTKNIKSTYSRKYSIVSILEKILEKQFVFNQ